MLKPTSIAIILVMISMPAKAHGEPTTGLMLILLLVHLLPYIVGVFIVGKGHRVWFTVISFITYSLSFGTLQFTGLLTGLGIISFFFPYLLIIVVIFVRWRHKQSNRILQKGDSTQCPKDLLDEQP